MLFLASTLDNMITIPLVEEEYIKTQLVEVHLSQLNILFCVNV